MITCRRAHDVATAQQKTRPAEDRERPQHEPMKTWLSNQAMLKSLFIGNPAASVVAKGSRSCDSCSMHAYL